MKKKINQLITRLVIGYALLNGFVFSAFAHKDTPQKISHAISIAKQIEARVSSIALNHNIAFQQEYDIVWDAVFKRNDSITEQGLGLEMKQLIESKEFYQDNPFFIGFSSSAYQFEGGIGDECSWHAFALRNGLTLPGEGCGFWDNYEVMIKEMKEIGHINAFRMSIEWSRIEPIEGQYNIDAILHYRKIIKTLRKNGIEPVIVLNHYTLPQWFENKGDFVESENISYFVRFASKMYLSLYDLVTYWSTCNAPEGIAFKGRYTLTGAPGKEKSLQKTMIVMQNILEAHVQIYEAIKGNPLTGTTGLWQEAQKECAKVGQVISEPMIGIQKNIIQFDIAYDTALHYMCAPLTNMMNKMAVSLSDDPFYSFFTTGHFFSKSVAPWTNVSHTNKMAPYSVDWIGVNYYSNKKRFLLSDVPDTDPRKKTNNENYRFYPQGLYRAVCQMNEKLLGPIALKTNRNIPIWITENGIAAIDDTQRQEFNKKIMIVLRQLIQENFPIIGYTQWASHDNWEWGSKAGTKRYGSFFVDFDNVNGPHPLKVGAQGLTEFMKEITA
jgi:beta-glucosidase